MVLVCEGCIVAFLGTVRCLIVRGSIFVIQSGDGHCGYNRIEFRGVAFADGWVSWLRCVSCALLLLFSAASLWGGVAGFCFSNIMLFSFPEYLNFDSSFLEFRAFFAWLILEKIEDT